MLRDAIRNLLQRHWPADKAKVLAAQSADLRGIWRLLAEQGCTALGADPAIGGLQDILVVMEELGRAACPAPVLDAAVFNLAISGADMRDFLILSDLHSGKAYPCVSFADMDLDPSAGGVMVSSKTISGKIKFI